MNEAWCCKTRIRKFRSDDAATLAQIYHQAVRTIGIKYHAQDQVEAWSPEVVAASSFLNWVSDGRLVFVAVDDNDSPVAFIELEADGHIDCFYCHPNYFGTGVGASLYEQLESAALASRMPSLYVEASEVALRFFIGREFTIIGRRKFERNKVQIDNYLMEKNFCGNDSSSKITWNTTKVAILASVQVFDRDTET